jgi:hypothetical protein
MHYDTADRYENQADENHERGVEKVVERIDSWYPSFRIERSE